MNQLDTAMDMSSSAETDVGIDDARAWIPPAGILSWDMLTDSQRASFEFLTELLKQYKSRLRPIDDEASKRWFGEQITPVEARVRELKDVAKEQLKQKTQELQDIENDDKQSKLRDHFVNVFLKEHEIYYVASMNIYMEYFPDTGSWVDMQPQALQTQYAIRGNGVYDAFQAAMHKLGRKKMAIECSFYPKPSRILTNRPRT